MCCAGVCMTWKGFCRTIRGAAITGGRVLDPDIDRTCGEALSSSQFLGTVSGAAAFPAGSPGESMSRFLYILGRDAPVLQAELYEQLRCDMATGPVELLFDRRREERRQHHIEEEIARVGWARVQIE